jgi:murein DD-endopeptidase MepM/ murein hydrolase activator NlpD
VKWFGTSAGSATGRHVIQKTARVGTLILVSVCLLGLPGATSPASADSFSAQIGAARARQVALRRAIAQQDRLLGNLQSDAADARDALLRTGSQLDGINADQAQVKGEIKHATAALAKVQARRAALQDELRQLDQTLDLLEQEIAQGAAELDARRAELGTRLADAYRTQNTSLLQQILDAGSFTDVVTDTSAYLAYGDQDALLASQIADDQASLDSLRAITAATRYRTDQLRRAAQDTAVDLRAQRQTLADAKARLARLERKTRALQRRQLAKAHRIAATQRQARAIAREHQIAQRKLDRHIAGLVRAAERRAAQQAAARRAHHTQAAGGGTGNGRFAWPTAGIVTQEYGCTGFYLEPPRGSCAHFHRGIDIANASGTPIRAADDGVVAYVGWNKYDSDPAFVVVIGHAGGFSTSYAHLLPRRVVHNGQRVRRGQLIGYMGSTGNSTGSHLHFEILRGNATVNPRAYT